MVEGWIFVGRYYWQRYRTGVDLDRGRNLSRAATAAALAPYGAKVLHTRRSRVAVRAVAQRLSASSRPEPSSPSNR